MDKRLRLAFFLANATKASTSVPLHCQGYEYPSLPRIGGGAAGRWRAL